MNPATYGGAEPPPAAVRFPISAQRIGRRDRFVAVLPDVTRPAEQPDAIVDRLSLLDLLDRLPPRRRAVLILRYCCDLSIDQTAQLLGCSPGTVKSQSNRALATLRTYMSRTPGEPAWHP